MEAGGSPDGETVGGICMCAGDGDGKTPPQIPSNVQILETSVSWDSNPGLEMFWYMLPSLGRAASPRATRVIRQLEKSLSIVALPPLLHPFNLKSIMMGNTSREADSVY